MDFINFLIDNYNIPVLSAFLLGILTSISPCPLATNITAIAYISKEIKSSKQTLLNGFAYALGRVFTYTLLATLIYFGLSSFEISKIFQGWGDKVLGPVLIILGLLMLGVIKINLKFSGQKTEKIKEFFARRGYLGSFFLGLIFALAFCPYSGVLFFGALIPLVLSSSAGFLLAPIFALGTALPVIVVSFILAFAINKIGQTFNVLQKVEKIMRYLIALVFLGTGLYYSQYLVKFIWNLL